MPRKETTWMWMFHLLTPWATEQYAATRGSNTDAHSPRARQ